MVNKKITNEKSGFVLIIGITIMIFSIYVFISFFNMQGKNQGAITKGTENILYYKLIDYEMPVIKITSFDGSNVAKDIPSLKSDILNYVGINLSNPEEILKKEISYLNEDNDAAQEDTAAIGDFNISNSAIIEDQGNLNNQSQISGAYDPRLKKTLNNAIPEVLIYQSHTTESYGADGNDSLDPTKNVTAIGNLLTSTLENDYGISVIHDTTIYNASEYDNSYERSGQTLSKYLQEYGNFKMIIDLDRTPDSNSDNVIKNINGENVAKFTFVMARNNPHFYGNMSMVNLLLNYSNNYFPGLSIGDGVNYDYSQTNFFNQDKSNNAFLLEIGSNKNTINEAMATTKYIARIIAKYLNDEQFINTVAPAAQATYKKDKVFPSVTIAQAMQESAEGTSELTTEGNNLFGIKAFDWPGRTINMPTRENYNGINHIIMGKFRAYNNWEQSIEDHGDFLVDNSIYAKHGVFSATNYADQAKALKAAGYATDPNYAYELINLIKEYDLNKYDNVK
jgi:stage II sporulation protein P